MTQLLIVACPELARGFQLAGIAAYGVPDAESAKRLIEGWLDDGVTGLLVLDAGLLADMDAAFFDRLENAWLPYVIIPGDKPLGSEFSRQSRIAELIRRAVGIHITLTGAAEE